MSDQTGNYYASFCKLVSEDDGDIMTPDQNAIRIGVPLETVHEVHVTQRGKEYDRIFVRDSAGRNAGFLPKQLTRKLLELFEAGWLCHVVPTLIVYSKKAEGYWAEVAVVCYAPEQRAAFDAFLAGVCRRYANGDHADVRLSVEQVSKVLESDGAWHDVPNAPLPHIDKQSAIYKSRQSSSEKLATTAIEHTTGCYIALIVATLAVVALAVWFFFLR